MLIRKPPKLNGSPPLPKIFVIIVRNLIRTIFLKTSWKCSFSPILSKFFEVTSRSLSPPPLKHRLFKPSDVFLAPIYIVKKHRNTAISYVRIGPPIRAGLLIRYTTGIVPMAYKEMLAYETLNVACDYKWGTVFSPQLHFW